jgi:hypothetical protein
MKFFIAVLAAVGLRENKRIGRIAEAHRNLGQTRKLAGIGNFGGRVPFSGSLR